MDGASPLRPNGIDPGFCSRMRLAQNPVLPSPMGGLLQLHFLLGRIQFLVLNKRPDAPRLGFSNLLDSSSRTHRLPIRSWEIQNLSYNVRQNMETNLRTDKLLDHIGWKLLQEDRKSV